ncbi:hypothetical protein ES703_65367 [subsurface metagenome]
MGEYPITISIEYPERLSRLTTFFRYLLVIPQMIAIYFLAIAAGAILFISWWAIIITGRYPRWAFDFIAGYIRWSMRLSGYSTFLTDKYPPFSMS